MAESSWPSPTYNAGAVSDQEYEQLSYPYTQDGLVGSTADTSLIYGDSSGMQVKVRSARYGLVRGRLWYSGTSDFTKSISSNSSGSTRVDLVVLRLTRSTWNVTVEVRAGTPGAGAPAAVRDLGTTGVYEVEVASVSVANGAATITAGNVTNLAWYVTDGGYMSLAANRPPTSILLPGAHVFETDTTELLVYTGSGFAGLRPRLIRKTATESRTSTTTFADDNTLTLAVAASGVYWTQLFLSYDGATGGDIKWQLVGPSGATFVGAQSGLNANAATNLDTHFVHQTLAQDAIQGALGASTTTASLTTGLTVVSSTAGNLKLQWAQGTSSATATRLFAGSFLMLLKVP